MKKISIVTPCYNEEENVRDLHEAVKVEMSKYVEYSYEHIFIDNCSKDGTQKILEDMASKDKCVKVVLNARNFGSVRSHFYALKLAEGDAVISMAADFQDPPNMINELIRKWNEGYKIVIAVKTASKENKIVYAIRGLYYSFVRRIAEIELIDNYTGFGLYDKIIMDEIRKINDPYPYFRGLICEIGFDRAEVEFTQPRRAHGISKHNFYMLYDMAMLGITSNSKIPLRIATMAGFLFSGISILVAVVYLILKLVFWNFFLAGTAPILIGLFFFSSVQLFFIGILGEYIINISTHVQARPLVIEKKRINFDD